MEQRTLKKSNDRVLVGVCGGIAEYFGWDPVMVRFMFIMIAIFGGSSFVAYFILMFIMPKADAELMAPSIGPGPSPPVSPSTS